MKLFNGSKLLLNISRQVIARRQVVDYSLLAQLASQVREILEMPANSRVGKEIESSLPLGV